MKELGVGIVGLGWVAGAHIETFKGVNGAGVKAVCSRRDLNPVELKARFGLDLKVYGDLNDMIADPAVDIVDICTPHPYHPDQAVVAAEAGKHLIIEKPIAIDREGARRIRDAVAKNGVRTCVCFECRFSKHFTLIRSVLDQGLLGRIHYAEVDYYHGVGPWYGQFAWNVKKEIGGSSMITAGCHAVDALLMFMDGQVDEVMSLTTRSAAEAFKPYEYDTTSVALLKFSDGAIAKVTSVIDCLQPYYFHVHLVGSHGSLLDNRIYSERLSGLSKEKWSTLETVLIDSGDVVDHPYLPQFQAFIDAIREGREMPLTDLATAYETHRVVFAADQAAAEGRPVRIQRG